MPTRKSRHPNIHARVANPACFDDPHLIVACSLLGGRHCAILGTDRSEVDPRSCAAGLESAAGMFILNVRVDHSLAAFTDPSFIFFPPIV